MIDNIAVHPHILWLLGAALMGLRHATDPDHVVAVAELVACGDNRTGRAALVTASWGLGHLTVLFLAGLAAILFDIHVPPSLQATCERAVGIVVIFLAVRIFLSWFRGDYALPHACRLNQPRQRTPITAFGVGVLHGLAGTGGVMILLLDTMVRPTSFLAAILIFGTTMTFIMVASTSIGALCLARKAPRRLWASHGAPLSSILAAVFGMLFFFSA